MKGDRGEERDAAEFGPRLAEARRIMAEHFGQVEIMTDKHGMIVPSKSKRRYKRARQGEDLEPKEREPRIFKTPNFEN